MRTTLDIDPDILSAVKARARRERRSAGAVLSDLARQALTGGDSAAPSAGEDVFYGFRPLPADGRVVGDETVERLRDELGIRCVPCSTSTCRSRCWTPRSGSGIP